MTAEYVVFAVRNAGCTLLFSSAEADGAGASVPFHFQVPDDASVFLSKNTNKIYGLSNVDLEMANGRGSSMLGLLELSEELRCKLTALRQSKVNA
jgi:hypothetical protein